MAKLALLCQLFILHTKTIGRVVMLPVVLYYRMTVLQMVYLIFYFFLAYDCAWNVTALLSMCAVITQYIIRVFDMSKTSLEHRDGNLWLQVIGL